MATDLVYRSLFTSAAPDLRHQAAELFAAWASGKGVPVTSAALLKGTNAEGWAEGVRRVAHGAAGSHVEKATGRKLHAALFRLQEFLPDGTTWTTSLRVAVPYEAEQHSLLPEADKQNEALLRVDGHWPSRPWVWLDLEHDRAEGSAPVRPGSPRLIRDLLAAVEGTDASLPLTSDVLDITESHVGELCGWLFDSDRRVPVIVFSPDPETEEKQKRFADRLARDVTGVAVVVRLHSTTAAGAFSRRVGPHLQVNGGAMRTYLPGLMPNEPFPRRHRVLSAATMRALGQRSANAVRDQVLGLSTRRTPPASSALVRRALSRTSVERTAPERRLPTAQTQLFPAPNEPVVLPGLDPAPPIGDSDTQPAQPVVAESAEGNRLLRATLTLAGIDPSPVELVDDPADPASLEAERRALQQLLLATRSEVAGTAKLAEATEEISLLYAEVEELTAQLGEERKVRAEIEDLRYERDLGELDLADLERDNERLRARIRWLESELSVHYVHVAGRATPDQIPLPTSVVEALELAATHLPLLVIGQTSDAAAGLDVHPQAERWALKVWQALAALNSYAEARTIGAWSNSFLAWCQEPLSGGLAVPATWTALSESETTNTTPKLREARTFPVPPVVDPGGRLYMPAHVKIQQGGSPCPRIHFHDDAGGRSGQVYVGYVGDHLPTANFR
ncbi:hypothetical protein [Actinoplanes sp. RD1]|uniref:hypothetical protein n=1 Tax=Actinoplanes sp. RD1 TaxID=3064538 RepID=UPI002740D9B5|nr:hypothetical protein [Actinoplanes sp. RD1]